MVTTLNSSNQRLKVFCLGLPGNTLTQEGLSILATSPWSACKVWPLEWWLHGKCLITEIFAILIAIY